jgi:hypothetical protein
MARVGDDQIDHAVERVDLVGIGPSRLTALQLKILLDLDCQIQSSAQISFVHAS